MTPVTLAEVMCRRVPLTAREAVTVTLAVAKEWDRQRAVRGPITLPDIGAIHLLETGAVFFLVTPDTPIDHAPTTTDTLSSLLGRLLGTDEAVSLRHPAAVGLGATDVPSVPDESFRSVLTRFAGDDYSKVVATVVERTLKSPPRPTPELQPQRIHAGPERRKQPRIVAELRLDIRELEKELYALRASSQQTPSKQVTSKRRAVARVACAAGAASVLALVTILAIERNPMRPGSSAVDGLTSGGDVTESVPVPVRSASTMTTVTASVVADVTPVHVGSLPRLSTHARRTVVRHRRAVPAPTPRSRPSVAFPGGARTISWLGH